jgi:3-oxoacyl-[acyl-carrier protein] reductase
VTPAAGARDFQDHAVIVTGGSRGIGRAITLAFAEAGADIVLNYAQNLPAAQATAAAVEAQGRRCVLVPGSVAEPAVAEQLKNAALEAFGRIDVLVNNAGITRDGTLMLLRDAAWQELLGVNLHGTFYCCQAVIETMVRQRSGAIVNMASTAGLKGRAGQVNYAASKGAIIALTKSLAQELGPCGVRVNAVAPGMIETEMVETLLGRSGVRDTFVQATPLRRIGQPEDVAAAVVYLASSAAAYVAGHVLLVNGGLFM